MTMTMTNKIVAETIILAQKLHEESYVLSCGNECHLADKFGEYSRTQEDCWFEACKTKELPDDFWYVLHLANHWYNDLQIWAECILVGQTFTEEINEPIVEDEVQVPKSCKGLRDCVKCVDDSCPINSDEVQAITDEKIKRVTDGD